ncbi:hypothetical protein AB1Y20_010026 [Prymnesium parvum]|uniref:Uncharacterized protein n=1 Tax=Prymnesium parvum TaxID=97485 RepID=A0AB34K377_PRYPA|mmetsp:Transcript_963/g.2503  ORF Transcript_963/g.2503 Transcript_963/m.2503 type:complete len:313 (-) Transcript_963:424-1362(-)
MSTVYQAGQLIDYPDILAAASDVTVYLGAPERDKCHSATAYGTIAAAEKGCGLVVARDGVAVPYDSHDPRATFVANGRNPIYVRTHFRDYHTQNDVTHSTLLSLRVTTDTNPDDKLCENALVIREEYVEGIEEISIDGLPDPTKPNNPATLTPGEFGNTFYIVPFSRGYASTPPFPQMDIVLVPLLVHEQSYPVECTSTGSSLTSSSSTDDSTTTTTTVVATEICYASNVTLTRLDPIRFTVFVRTEPKLEPTYPETVQNCFYASSLARTRFLGGSFHATSSASALSPHSTPMILAVTLLGWFMGRGLGKPR